MKRTLLIAICLIGFNAWAQKPAELVAHYEAYYKQMKLQGDAQGVINAMTHLNVLVPNQARKDTLAYIYMSEGRNIEALNTIGIESSPSDSNINVEVKAVALKAINQPQRALLHYDVLFSRNANPKLAYEIAEIRVQIGDFEKANELINYGLKTVTPEMKRGFFESQPSYETTLEGAFYYLQAIILLNQDQVNNVDASIALLDKALALDANFRVAQLSKDALEARKKED